SCRVGLLLPMIGQRLMNTPNDDADDITRKKREPMHEDPVLEGAMAKATAAPPQDTGLTAIPARALHTGQYDVAQQLVRGESDPLGRTGDAARLIGEGAKLPAARHAVTLLGTGDNVLAPPQDSADDRPHVTAPQNGGRAAEQEPETPAQAAQALPDRPREPPARPLPDRAAESNPERDIIARHRGRARPSTAMSIVTHVRAYLGGTIPVGFILVLRS